jgi:hypothetical protein
MRIHGLVQSFQELQSKLSPSIRYNPLGHSMQIDNPRHIQLCKLQSSIGCLDGYEMSYTGQSVHNYPNRIISRLSPMQSHDEIHSNLFPLPHRYLQGLQQSCRSLMLGIDSLIGIAKGNIFGNISLHSVPPRGCLEIMIHLIPSWMNRIRGLVGLPKYLILQLLEVRHTDPPFIPQHSLVIFRKSGWLLFLDIALNLQNLYPSP